MLAFVLQRDFYRYGKGLCTEKGFKCCPQNASYVVILEGGLAKGQRACWDSNQGNTIFHNKVLGPSGAVQSWDPVKI